MNITLDAPKISCRKCAKQRALTLTYPVVDPHEEDHACLREDGEEEEDHPGEQHPRLLAPQPHHHHHRQQREKEVDQGQEVRGHRQVH